MNLKIRVIENEAEGTVTLATLQHDVRPCRDGYVQEAHYKALTIAKNASGKQVQGTLPGLPAAMRTFEDDG